MRDTYEYSATLPDANPDERQGAICLSGGGRDFGTDALIVGADGFAREDRGQDSAGSSLVEGTDRIEQVRRRQYLYLIGAKRAGPINVGIAADVKSRRRELQTGHPYPLLIYWIYPCPQGRVLELSMHRILAPRRLKGEWFNVTAAEAMGALMVAYDVGKEGVNLSDQDMEECRQHIGLYLGIEKSSVVPPPAPMIPAKPEPQPTAPAKFDRVAYQRAYMREYRKLRRGTK